MKIRTHLTILFTIITGSILCAFASIVYYSAKKNRENEFFSVLDKEAITKANLFFNTNVNKKTMQIIYHSNQKILNEVQVAIYDESFGLLYHDAKDNAYVHETKQMFNDIVKKKEIKFFQEKWQVVGFTYPFKGQSYIITATAIDQYGYNKLNNLLQNLILVFIGSILIIYLAGRFFSQRAFKSVKEMIDKAMRISASNLHLRLPQKNNGDELSELANAFNKMLSRLENSFEAQKQFVSNISHELRTPLAAIIAELELSLTKDQSKKDYKNAIQNTLNDAKKLTRLSNNFLDFAKASYDPSEIAFKKIRIDEIILDARHHVQKANPKYKIDIHFKSTFENDNEISTNGNEYLLMIAFANLFENGCKFSDDTKCALWISINKGKIILVFSDNGIGISAEDKKKIFTPFYRGHNKNFAEGHGIGLSLTQKILFLHNASVTLDSQLNLGTSFTVILNAYKF